MSQQLLDKARVDRTAFFGEHDLAYRRARTPEERLEALELSRQIAYGYDPTARGLSQFFGVAQFPPS